MYLFHFCCIPFSAKDCYYYFYFYHCMTLVSLSIFWSIYFYKFMCVLVCCSSNDCYFCDCVIAFLLLLLRVFSSSFGMFVVATSKATHKKAKTSSKVFCSVVSVFCLVRGSCMLSSCAWFLLFFVLKKTQPNKRI